MKQNHKLYLHVRNFMTKILHMFKKMFSIKIFYHHLLASFSFITLSCGLLNLIGHEPYTSQLILVGGVGLLLSSVVSIYHFVK